MPEEFDPIPFHLEHIISRKHRGQTLLANLALSCSWCNLYKSSNLAGLDPVTGQLTRLFHPRLDDWADHFEWRRAVLTGITDIGRVTVDVLVMNDPERTRLRTFLIRLGVFPPARGD